jgi:glycogen synthase
MAAAVRVKPSAGRDRAAGVVSGERNSNATMRILLISWEYPPYVVGGIGTHVAQLVPHLGGAMVDGAPLAIDVITTRFAGGEPVEAVGESTTIHRVDVPAMDAMDLHNSVVDNNHYFVEYALELAKQHTYDAVHVHDWLTAEAGIRLKHHWKVPLIVTMHATERGRHQGYLPSSTSMQIDRLEWRVTYEAWKVIACSTYMCAEMERYFGLPSDKVVVIPNGVIPPAHGDCHDEELAALRLQYAPNGESLIFFVGRIVHEKGVQVLVRAMPRILAQHPNTRLLIAGKNSQKLYPLAYELGVEKSVEFLGYISDSTRDCLYEIVDVAVFPSLYEPFGIVALEAMAAGCNVIASDTGGLGEVVRHEVCGLTAYPGDPLSIAWAVDRLLSDPEAAAYRRARALDMVHSIYRWDHIGAQTIALYRQVYKERLTTTDW